MANPGRETGQKPPKADPPAKYIDSDNVVSVLTFIVMALVVAILPEKAVRSFCFWIPRIHIMLRGSKTTDLANVSELPQSEADLRVLEQKILTRSYLELAQPFLERRKSGWHPDITLEGRNHLDSALSDGTGAVLWVVPFFSGEMVFRKAIHAAKFPVVDLRAISHPYSGTTFGRKYLNPIRLVV